MNGIELLIDSNILIYLLNGYYSDNKARHIAELVNRKGSISAITRVEILGWHGHSPSSLKNTKQVLGKLPMHGLSSQVLEEAIRLRQQKAVKLGDALIGATAIVHDLHLLTENAKDFSHSSIKLYTLS